MRDIWILSFLILASLPLLACSNGGEETSTTPTITITTSEFTVGFEAGSEIKATFDINIEWSTTITYEGATKDWLTATPPSGKAGKGQSLTMKAAENPSEEARKAYVTINYGVDKKHKITVTQLGKAGEAPTITITTSEFTVGYQQNSEATATFDINVDWTATTTYEGTIKDWLTVSPTEGAAGTGVSISMKAALNPEFAEARTAYVTINYGVDKKHKITVTQKKNDDITKYFDPSFAALLQKLRYIADATNITIDNVKDINGLIISGGNASEGDLTSLAGIEYFASLEQLSCEYNIITSLDVSKNLKLSLLNCRNNQIDNLDVSKNISLKWLSCGSNLFPVLDVSKNTNLTFLSCRAGKFTSLDVSKNTKLIWLICHTNLYTSIDISNNPNLTQFECYGNPGDGATFPVKVAPSFDLTKIPVDFTQEDWIYETETITINYHK